MEQPTRPGFSACVPRPGLRAHIHFLWQMSCAPASHAREALMPDGSMQIVINLIGDHLHIFRDTAGRERVATAGVLVNGVQTTRNIIATCDQSEIMGVHFKPGGAAPFLGLPAEALADVTVPLNEVWGREADGLHDRLRSATSTRARFAILESSLARRIADPERHPAVSYLLERMDRKPQLSLERLTDRVGYSRRHLTRLFRKEVGLRPVLFRRLCRFQALLAAIRADREPDWGKLAFEYGFYDQAHLINEVRVFSGFSPTEYATSIGPQPNHIPLR